LLLGVFHYSLTACYLSFFRVNPKPFCELAKGLYPGLYKPTPTHCFIRLLAEKKVLLRNFTQNIDTLEFGAKIPKEKVVQAHGGFSSARCIKCGTAYSPDFVRREIFADRVPQCEKCTGLVKPDIVFFGESLPKRFHRLSAEDMPKCDLLLVLGTSLQVHPFAGLVDEVDEDCVRLLFNREPVGRCALAAHMRGLDKDRLKEFARRGDTRAQFLLQMIERQEAVGLRFGMENNVRDMFVKGNCDDGVLAFAEALGWSEDLAKIIAEVDGAFKASGEGQKKQALQASDNITSGSEKKTGTPSPVARKGEK